MKSQIADDFHAALVAMQEMTADQLFEDPTEQATNSLVEHVFAFLDTCNATEIHCL